jgi:hypothetical protein
MEAALTGLAIAVLAMLAGLIPYLGAAAKAALVVYTEGKHNKALDAGAVTIAVAHDGLSVAAQASMLAQRFPDAIAALSPAASVLEDKMRKAREVVSVGRLASEATGLEGRGA